MRGRKRIYTPEEAAQRKRDYEKKRREKYRSNGLCVCCGSPAIIKKIILMNENGNEVSYTVKKTSWCLKHYMFNRAK